MNDELTPAHERQMLSTLLERIRSRINTEHEIESRHNSEVATEKHQFQTVFQHLTQSYQEEQRQLDQIRDRQLEESNQRCKTESATVQSEYQRVLNDAEDRFKKETESATKERDDSVWLVSSLLDDDTEGSPLQRQQQAQATFSAAAIELTAGMDELESGYQDVVRFLQRCRIWSESSDREASVSISTPDEMKSGCLAAIASSTPIRQTILGRLLPLLFIGVMPALVFLAMSAVVYVSLWLFVDPTIVLQGAKPNDPIWLILVGGIAAAFCIIPMFFLHHLASQRISNDLEKLQQLRADARFTHSVWERTSKTELNMLDAECSHLQDLRVKRRESAIRGAETTFRNRFNEAERIHSSTLQNARNEYPNRLNSIESRKTKEIDQLQSKYQTDNQNLTARRESDFRMLQSEFDNRMTEIHHRYQQSWLELIRTWHSYIAASGNISDQFCTATKSICRPWGEIVREEIPYPDVSPTVLSLGTIEVNLAAIEGGIPTDARLRTNRQQFDLPVLLPLRERPSLIIKTRGAGRDAAVNVLQATMLRFLTALPPGKVRFTIFDPVGLGANFSAFMHLADFDELLVTSRIWTEPSHIEKKLADLTEHMETVLQTYLRNEFPTIDDYNTFAGEVAEPYRILVVANFPANFTEVALRRLASIAEGGRRCGVYLLMSFDDGQELPRGFTATDLETHSTVLNWSKQGFRFHDPKMAQWPLKLDEPPAAEDFGQIVRLAGKHSRDVRRVEVPFERVAPSEGLFWTSDSRTGIDVPIGRAGATKLQSLRLGKGTSQHVLIAGKTGSGKSTLLHALITNLALYYSPAEVEFYLIDFKKGVEFKVYAEERLPHARVIAIESDREFGVSVLKRLDSLLRDRGELFREAGVQDIAGYRNARPDALMPRTLLLVDEFQEFFIEDDALSQEAAMLFDRLIRQGRAFGVHILLGSQTLAGAYSLARSTLGQVAVRIALQCSDTDAHLILSEENTAARLLTRPGEAIYNDANGLIEGNHPFQIVWLNDHERGEHLKRVREAARQGLLRGKMAECIRVLSATPPLVFEGNIPANPTTNPQLQKILARNFSARNVPSLSQPLALDSSWNCWLGDSVSLGGPMQMSFGLREGGNTLIVGRDGQAALGVMAACALALAGHSVRGNNSSTTIYVLDGSLPNSESAQTWQLIEAIWKKKEPDSSGRSEATLPTVHVATLRETNSVLNNLLAEIHRRSDEPGQPAFLFIFDLARFRDLRKAEDDFSYGGSIEKTVSPAQCFTEILRDGPGVGVFTFAWVDSYQTVQRWLSRDQINRFDQRVLFAMNVNDSSSLVDSPLAGRLGENRALLYRGDTGTLEKFRPFSPPPNEWLQRIAVGQTETAALETELNPIDFTESKSPTIVESFVNPIAPSVPAISDELPSIDDLHVL